MSAYGLVTLIFVIFLHAGSLDANPKSYIIYMGRPLEGQDCTALHHEKLAAVLGQDFAKKSFLYSYKHIFNGFSALIPPDKVEELSNLTGVKMVMEDRPFNLQTTYSWQFLGLQNADGTVANGKIGQIESMLDSGIWPESASFDDSSYSSVPENWNGLCVNTSDFSSTSDCNRKIIGARFYSQAANTTGELLSPRDTNGHGTHTASTAAGSFVEGANYRGLARGTARGGAYGARLSIYKVCWGTRCGNADILAAIDDGIGDGVDVFNLSFGGDSAIPETEDPLALGTLQAAMRGISVVTSAGNYGPNPATISNVAPWMITVGASTTDRVLASNVILGDDSTLMGESLSGTVLEPGLYPLVAASDVSKANISSDISMTCTPGLLDPQKAQGKIVLCSDAALPLFYKGVAGLVARAAGIVVANSQKQGETLAAVNHVLPATNIGYKAGQAIVAYMKSTRDPMAYITRPETSTSSTPAPEVAAFSSRGPNSVSPEILKPDVIAPGVNILAAFSEFAQNSSYVILSGTSMACPHVTGIVALLKSLHPDWSPAAIQSAIITTAKTTNNVGEPIKDQTSEVAATPFDIGGGQIDPQAAADPGLVYDASPADYFSFYCQKLELRYPDRALDPECGTDTQSFQLNYPSISVTLKPGTSVTIRRRLKSVMDGASEFRSRVEFDATKSLTISVNPSTLNFTAKGDEVTFDVEFSIEEGSQGEYAYGSLIWSGTSGHNVRSPIVVKLET